MVKSIAKRIVPIAGILAILALVLGFAGAMLSFPQGAGAADVDDAQQLGITCDNVEISGNTWTISGTWLAYNFPGKSTQYDVAAFSPEETVADSSSKDSPDLFTIVNGVNNFVGSNVNKTDMDGTWSNVLTFGETPTYLAATLYHAQVPGNEQSGDAFCTFTLPVCSDGIDNEDDGVADEDDPGCWTDPNDPETYDPEDNDEEDPTDVCPNDEGIQTDPEQCTPYGTLTLLKVVSGGDAADTDWTLEADGPDTILGEEGDAEITNALVLAGTYTLAEDGGPNGYQASDWVCEGGTQDNGNTVTIADGEDVTCTITNTFVPPNPGTLSVRKLLTNNDGGDNAESTFSFKVNGGDSIQFEFDARNDILVAPGFYTVVEDAAPGYAASYSNCSNIEVVSGQTTICEIRNNDEAPTLKLVKIVDGGEASAADWTLFAQADGGSDDRDFSNAGNAGAFMTVFANTAYGLSEGSEQEHYQAGSWICDGGVFDSEQGTITLSEGEDVTCTITNFFVPPTSGLVTICKYDVFENLLSGWEVWLTDGESTYSGTTGENGCVEVGVVPFGEYTLDETLIGGWANDFGKGMSVTVDDETETFNLMNELLPICSNGLDDDDDQLADSNDPGCWEDPNDPESYNPEDSDETNPEDFCSNLEGIQTSVPEGLEQVEGQCLEPQEEPADLCPNLQGVQASIPDGYFLDNEGECETGGGGGGGGGRRHTVGGGEVLGAATECSPLLTQFLKIGQNNPVDEVTKLQNFLNQFTSAGLPVTGLFGPMTFDAVSAFQVQYGGEVLTPWIGFPGSGISAANDPTGYVYQTTKWKINNLWCPGSEAFPTPLI